MKSILITLFLLLSSHATTLAQGSCTLFLENNKLNGSCEHKYFNGFEIELDSTYTSLDSATFFRQFPRIGKINTRNQDNNPTEFTITKRGGYPQILFRLRTTYLTFDNLKIEGRSISFTIDRDPEVPATSDDLKVIRIAKNILSKEDNWHKQDDRTCDDDITNKSYSLYCALRIASLEVEEKYNHRNATLQKLRHLIELKHPNKKWDHRLMDFNNMEETKYEDIVDILDDIEQNFINEISLKN